MAKRSVRKQRRDAASAPAGRTPAPAAPASSRPAAAWRTPAFWLGGLVIGLTLVAITVAAFLVTGDDATPAPAPATEAAAGEGDIKSAEQLEQEFAARDREQIEALTGEARTVAQGLQPVMRGLEAALPYDGGAGEPATDAEVQSWLDATRDIAAPYQESVSGDTGYNVARSTIRASLDGLVSALEVYRLARGSGDPDALREQAAAQRDNAVRTWSAAGVQLDALNIAAGFGHQHVEQLAGAAAGGQAPDTLPEGTDAHAEGE